MEFFDEQLRSLSPRMSLVAFYLSQGYPDANIAACMGISPETAKRHVYNLRDTLGFDGTRTGLAIEILRRL